MDKSGEVGWPETGTLVWTSSFKIPRSELQISSENCSPRWSWMVECQRGSCAFRSPIIMASLVLSSGLRLGEWPGGQLLLGGM